MGCDIHTIAQVFFDGKWRTVDENLADEPRNYSSFAMLAGVRKGSIDLPLISPPRGIPDDLIADSAELENNIFQVYLPLTLEKWLGDHSHSWLLLSEMQEFYEKKVKGKTYLQKGVVNREDYLKYKSTGEPITSWSGSVGGGSTLVVSENQINEWPYYTHVDFSWTREMESAAWSFKEYMDELVKLSQQYDEPADHVRFVFGFDN